MPYIPKPLPIQAFVPPAIYDRWKERSAWFIDSRIVWTAFALSEHFGKPIRANTWYEGGSLRYRGFRPAGCGVGAVMGQHYFGRALDCDVVGISAERVRKEIVDNKFLPAFQYITCIESDVSWLHIDCRETGSSKILVVKP